MTLSELASVLAELNTAGTPWFAAVPGTASRPAAQAVIDLTGPHLVPITVNPFEPAPRRSVHAHLERLATLVEAAYRPPGPVRAVLRLALRQVYTECGWDLASGVGRALPGAVAPPWLPGIADLTRAAARAAADLGCGATVRAAVKAFCTGTLLPLWHGPAGRFLHGGHPPDLRAAATGSVLFTAGAVGDADAAFLTGVMLYRLADELRTAAGPPVVVIAVPAARLRRVLDDLADEGVSVRHAAPQPGSAAEPGNRPVPGPAPAAVAAAPAVEPSGPVPLLGRRSAACGLQCRQRPCTDRELHHASRRAGHDKQVWLRLWTETLLLAFLTGNTLPQVPHPLRRSLLPLDVRTRECALATLIDAAVARRARALRYSYDPARLTAVAASAAAGLLATAGPRPFRAGQIWVIPQLRWLHEAERLTPLLRDQPAPGDIAPPLDFELAGLVDWPGIRVADRLEGLRCHQLSMDRAANRTLAMIALAGDDPHPLAEDIATAGIGRDHGQRLRYVARLLGTCPRGDGAGWLEEVLSWPSRLIGPAQAGPLPETAGTRLDPSAPASPIWQAATG